MKTNVFNQNFNENLYYYIFILFLYIYFVTFFLICVLHFFVLNKELVRRTVRIRMSSLSGNHFRDGKKSTFKGIFFFKVYSVLFFHFLFCFIVFLFKGQESVENCQKTIIKVENRVKLS